MTLEDEKIISEWHSENKKDVSVTCHFSNDNRTETFKAFCEKLSQLSPNIHVNFKKLDDNDAAPSIEVHKRIIYHAIPEGPELMPFLEGLTGFLKEDDTKNAVIECPLGELETPCFLRLFIASQCVFCPKMVTDLIPIAFSDELVSLTIIDAFIFPEMAGPFGIQSVPTLLLNEQMRWTGVTPVDEIERVMLNQDPSQLSAGSIENLLGDGRADLVAQLMMRKGKIFPAFIDTLVHEKWPVRLGAMVVMEEIIEHDRKLARQCVEPLWERFSDLNGQVRGDVIYILGEAGTDNMIPRLEGVLKDEADADIREAVQEAIKTMKTVM